MVKDTKKLFSKQLKSLRRSLGLSQGAMATKIGLALSSYQNLEAGKTTRIEVEKLIEIGRLGLNLGELLDLPAADLPSPEGAELARLRERVAQLTREAALKDEIYGEMSRSRSKLQEELDMLYPELNRLRAEVQALRAQAAAAALGPEEGRLMVRAGELLSLPPSASLEQILERVVGIFAAAKDEPRPTAHEPGPHGKGEEGGGGGREKRRANSS